MKNLTGFTFVGLSFNSILVRLDFETHVNSKKGLEQSPSFNSILVRLDFETVATNAPSVTSDTKF